MADATLDARGLNCPLPVLRARKAIAGLASGDVLTVLATDPGTIKDFQAFAEATGHLLLEQREVASEFHHRIQKAGRT